MNALREASGSMSVFVLQRSLGVVPAIGLEVLAGHSRGVRDAP